MARPVRATALLACILQIMLPAQADLMPFSLNSIQLLPPIVHHRRHNNMAVARQWHSAHYPGVGLTRGDFVQPQHMDNEYFYDQPMLVNKDDAASIASNDPFVFIDDKSYLKNQMYDSTENYLDRNNNHLDNFDDTLIENADTVNTNENDQIMISGQNLTMPDNFIVKPPKEYYKFPYVSEDLQRSNYRDTFYNNLIVEVLADELEPQVKGNLETDNIILQNSMSYPSSSGQEKEVLDNYKPELFLKTEFSDTDYYFESKQPQLVSTTTTTAPQGSNLSNHSTSQQTSISGVNHPSSVEAASDSHLDDVPADIASQHQSRRGRRAAALDATVHADECHATNLRFCGQPVLKRMQLKDATIKTKCKIRDDFLNCMTQRRHVPCPPPSGTADSKLGDFRRLLKKALASSCFVGYSKSEKFPRMN